MRRTLLAAVPVLLLAAPGWAPTARASDDKRATGIVTALAPDAVSVRVRDLTFHFTVDVNTIVEASGAGRKDAAARRTTGSGPRLTDVVKIGDPVAVTYREMNGKYYASQIRAKVFIANGGSLSTDHASLMQAHGEVRAIRSGLLTLAVSDGKTWTFRIDPSTKVFGPGAGTIARANGNKAPITDLITNGDRVRIIYQRDAGEMRASEIRIVNKTKLTASR